MRTLHGTATGLYCYHCFFHFEERSFFAWMDVRRAQVLSIFIGLGPFSHSGIQLPLPYPWLLVQPPHCQQPLLEALVLMVCFFYSVPQSSIELVVVDFCHFNSATCQENNKNTRLTWKKKKKKSCSILYIQPKPGCMASGQIPVHRL